MDVYFVLFFILSYLRIIVQSSGDDCSLLNYETIFHYLYENILYMKYGSC